MKLTKVILPAMVAVLMSGTLMANPDVFFADSAQYQDAYLVHELDGDNIKFKMSVDNAVPVALPAHSYDLNALEAYAKNSYQFQNPAFKADFGKMFGQSFESHHQTVAFLNELVRMLAQFAAAYPEHVH